MNSQNPPTSPQILLVSAVANRREQWADLLLQRYPQLTIVFAHDGASALYQCNMRSLTIAVIDIDLPDMKCSLTVANLRATQSALPIVLVQQTEAIPCEPDEMHNCTGLQLHGDGELTESLPKILDCRCHGVVATRLELEPVNRTVNA